MTKLRPIELNSKGHSPHWVGNGFRVKQYFPRGLNLLERFSPFILMDYNAPFEFSPSKTPRGIGAHPHRGFETVTFAFKGAVEHHDNMGNHGIIYPGDVQWMTAGAGILHKEYHEKEYSKQGGIFQMIQLWVNLPRKDKFADPDYQDLAYRNMGLHYLDDNLGQVTVVAGNFREVTGPASTFSPINIYIVNIKEGAKLYLEEPSDFNTGLLILDGAFRINGQDFNEEEFLLFKNQEGIIELEGKTEENKLIVLSGQPLNEPIVAGGPFVMSTREELAEAARDYREGRFGSEDF
ncbi:MAG: pirin family protein [Gudongella sp.]|jgi:redox-sensitive bicupin YhaK (pirin superfamily)|nr:pirin family protein [Gudongella sp.]